MIILIWVMVMMMMTIMMTLIWVYLSTPCISNEWVAYDDNDLYDNYDIFDNLGQGVWELVTQLDDLYHCHMDSCGDRHIYVTNQITEKYSTEIYEYLQVHLSVKGEGKKIQ